jgi:phage shock protein E
MSNPLERCQETRRLIEQGALLLDVRSESEFRAGCLQGAINHPVHLLSAGHTPEDKETPVIVYCVTGARSSMAKQMLLSAGFAQVHDLGSFQNIQAC